MRRRSSSGCDGRSEARTQGARVPEGTGATEDAASGRAARPDGTDDVSPSPPKPYSGSVAMKKAAKAPATPVTTTSAQISRKTSTNRPPVVCGLLICDETVRS